MKQRYALLAALGLSGALMAQTPYQAPAEKDIAVKTSHQAMTGHEVIPQTPRVVREVGQVIAPTRAGFTETFIGTTQYDLQSNGANQNRIENHDGTLVAGWTQSQQVSPFNDRGTGWNDATDYAFGDIPFDRLESQRVGWPSVTRTAGGRDIAITHIGFENLSMMYRDAGGAWQESEVETEVPMGLLWPRAIAGGADGNTIHMFALTTPIGNQLTTADLYQGMDGALLYYRSSDQGDTWEISDMLLPQMDSTQFLGFGGDSYAIAANGDKVAFAVFNDWSDSFVMISEDNGDNWTKRVLVDFPVDLFPQDDELLDLNEDMLADTVLNSDNAGALHIANDMSLHVTWGNMRYLDETLGDDQWTYFPFTDGLQYWNEDMNDGESMTIAFTTDLDDDGEITLAEDIGTYFTSLTGHPSMGSDAAGTLYVSYSGVVETHATGTQNYRHVFLMKSEDGGANWTDPVDATPDEEYIGYEAIFCTMAPVVDDELHMIYQRDLEPGLHVRGDEDPVDLNDIIYLAVTTDLDITGVEEYVADWDFNVYPNPTYGDATVVLGDMLHGTVQVLDMQGKEIVTHKTTTGIVSLSLDALAPGIYLVEAGNDIQRSTQRLIVH